MEEEICKEFCKVSSDDQAPINISLKDTTPLDVPELIFSNYDKLPTKMKLNNTGYTATLSAKYPEGCTPKISGGPLNAPYSLSQLHFHWGPGSCEGSEHTIECRRLPFEMHVVHINTRYKCQEEALQKKDGVVIVAYLFIPGKCNEGLQLILNDLCHIEKPNSSFKVTPRPIEILLPRFGKDFFMYWGAVISPNCSHLIQWLVCRKPLEIATEQLKPFRKLLNIHNEPLERNYRDVQPINGRKIFHCSPGSRTGATIILSASHAALLLSQQPCESGTEQDIEGACTSLAKEDSKSKVSLLASDKESAPAPDKESAPAPDKESAPAPDKESAPAPDMECVPASDKAAVEETEQEGVLALGEAPVESLEKVCSLPTSEADKMSLRGENDPDAASTIPPEKLAAKSGITEQTPATKDEVCVSTGEPSTFRKPLLVQDNPMEEAVYETVPEKAPIEEAVCESLPQKATSEEDVCEVPPPRAPSEESVCESPPQKAPSEEAECEVPPPRAPSEESVCESPPQKAPSEEAVREALPEKAPSEESVCEALPEKAPSEEAVCELPPEKVPSEESVCELPPEKAPSEEAVCELPPEKAPSEEAVCELPPEKAPSEETVCELPPEKAPSEESVCEALPEKAPSEDAVCELPPEKAPSEESVCELPPEKAPSEKSVCELPPEKAPSEESVCEALPEKAPSEESVCEELPQKIPSEEAVCELPPEKAPSEESVCDELPQKPLSENAVCELPPEKAPSEESVCEELPQKAPSEEAVCELPPEKTSLEPSLSGKTSPCVQSSPTVEPTTDGESSACVPASKEIAPKKSSVSSKEMDGDQAPGCVPASDDKPTTPQKLCCRPISAAHFTNGPRPISRGYMSRGFTFDSIAKIQQRSDKEFPDKPFLDEPLQSPIDIDVQKAVRMPLPPLQFSGHFDPGTGLVLLNNGVTVDIRYMNSPKRPFLTGGPLKGKYMLDSVHLHYIPNDDLDVGTHTINNTRTEIELHLVHIKEDFKSKTEAMACPNALAVVCILLQVGGEECAAFAKISQELPKIRELHQRVDLPDHDLAWLNSVAKPHDYFLYPGRFFGRQEGNPILWFVYAQPVGICCQNVVQFQKLKMSPDYKPYDTYKLDSRPLIAAVPMTCASNAQPLRTESGYIASIPRDKWPNAPFKSDYKCLCAPLNINTNSTENITLPPLEFKGHFESCVNIELRNTGETVNMKWLGVDPMPYLTGGPLLEDYEFDSAHFHWAQNPNDIGAMHRINSRRFALECHLVHYRKSCNTRQEAMFTSEGLCIVTFLLEVGAGGNPSFAQIAAALSKIREVDKATMIQASLCCLEGKANQYGYYMYPGALFGADRGINITWIVYPSPVLVCCQYVAQFYKLCCADENRMHEKHEAMGRPIYFACEPEKT